MRCPLVHCPQRDHSWRNQILKLGDTVQKRGEKGFKGTEQKGHKETSTRQ